MNVTCPNCSTIYRVDPAKVPAAGVRARCAVCAAIFPVRAEGAVVAPQPAPIPQESPAPAASAPVAAAPVAPAPVPPAPVAPAPVPAPVPVAATPVVEPPIAETPVAPPAPPAPPPMAPPMAPPAAAPARPAGAAGAPPRPASPAAMPRPAGVPPRPSMPAARPGGPAAMPPAAPPSPQREGPPRRAGNPFLSQDPSQKARRLARALISDMVVYHPAKRREGLRDGNLKELFDEEIKKSWEEFTDQVGRDLAESTSHFKDALNEILADGRQLF